MYWKNFERIIGKGNKQRYEKKTYARNLFLIPATQINTLKPFDMEPRKDISRKRFVSEEENN